MTDAQGAERTPAGVKPVRILEMLALEQGRALSKEFIADRLWDGAPPPSYVGTLESYVSNIRRALGCRGRASALATTTYGYRLSTEDVVVDVVEARRQLLAAVAVSDRQRATLVEQALGLLDGPLLVDDSYSLWAEQARAELSRLVTASCTDAARSALAVRDYETASRLAQRAVDLDPVAEAAWQTQLRALRGLGRTGEALAAYARLREATLEHLGVEPSSESRALYAELLAACDDGARGNDRVELSALVKLLRQRLEGWPGVVVPERDEHLAEVAVRILAVA